MLRFKSINFYQYRPKIKLVFAKKLQNFQALGSPPPDPHINLPIVDFGLGHCF